jgi:hypothetical protein
MTPSAFSKFMYCILYRLNKSVKGFGGEERIKREIP